MLGNFHDYTMILGLLKEAKVLIKDSECGEAFATLEFCYRVIKAAIYQRDI